MGRAFLFIGYMKENQWLYDELEKAGYDLVFKPIVKDRLGRVKGNVDAELVLHAMIEFPNYDEAIVVTGDGDFRCLVEYLKQQSKLGRILVPNRKKYSQLLAEFRTDMDFMNNLRRKLGKRRQKK